MKIIGIIPARMASTRFPGKPLAEIYGMPMLGHVYFRAKLCNKLDEVFIATCDEVIFNYAESINAACIMTSIAHERASDRAAEALHNIEIKIGGKIDVVVMIQGDEPMISPDMVSIALQPMVSNPDLNVVNLMSPLRLLEEFEDANIVKVVVDRQGYAMYFSREPIPSMRKGVEKSPMYRQVCIIPFRRNYLQTFNKLPQTPLEIVESIDMLRILEHGGRVKMIPIERCLYSVDTYPDLLRVIDAMKDDPLLPAYAKCV